MVKLKDELRNKLEQDREKLLESLADGTYKVDTSELSKMSAPLSWFKNNKKLLDRLDEIAKDSGLLKKK